MHTLQPKHSKLKPNEVDDLLKRYDIAVSQLPRIRAEDACVPEGCVSGDVIKVERVLKGEKREYFRVVVA